MRSGSRVNERIAVCWVNLNVDAIEVLYEQRLPTYEFPGSLSPFR